MEQVNRLINLNITSKFKKDVAKEIEDKINQVWIIDWLDIKYCGDNQWEIAFANFNEPHINTLVITMDIKDKTKSWNLNKDFNIVHYLANYERKI